MAAHPEFHDGFNLAGDDVLRAVVEKHVLGALAEAMAQAGVKNTGMALPNLFGREVMDRTQESRNLRGQFIRQVAVPVALCILALYEQADLKSGSGIITCRIRDCFQFPLANGENGDEGAMEGEAQALELPCPRHPAPNRAATRYLEQYVQDNGGDLLFNVLDVPLRIDPKGVNDTVRSALEEVLVNLCEVIHSYDCESRR